MRKKRCQPKGSSAWVVYWFTREDKVSKTTGTVITLLPRRYAADTVRKIIEALYSAYALPHSGQLEIAKSRSRAGRSLSRTGFYKRVEISENPGLIAVLAEDIVVEVDSSGINQIISWTDPDHYEPTLKQPGYRKTASGQFHKLSFNYMNHIQKPK